VDSFEWNKIFAAVIGTALFVMVITTFSDVAFHREEAGKPAYTVEVETEAGAVEAVVEEGPSLAELLAGGDADRGAKQYGKCRACHTADKGGRNGSGPNLYGIVGRGIAADDSFKYSGALAGQNANWTWELLDQWLANPKKTFSGTSMAFAGMRKEGQRADLLAYLRTLSDAPVDLPTVIVEATEAVQEAVEAGSKAAAEVISEAVTSQE